MTALENILAGLVHDWSHRAATGAPAILTAEAVKDIAVKLRQASGLARDLACGFARIVDERNQLLYAAEERSLIEFAREGAPRPVDPPGVIVDMRPNLVVIEGGAA